LTEPAAFTPPPPDAVLRALLDAHAPLRPAPLCPEIQVFHATSLVAIWEAAEHAAGTVLPSPFWAYPWPAGAGLARFILDHRDTFADRRVLDFGCGGGITSLAAARAGAAHVIANDIDPWALAVARLAAAAQESPLTITPCAADFTQEHASREPRTAEQAARTGVADVDLETISVGLEPYEVVLCGDLGYERSVAEAQRAVLTRAHNAGARVFVADAGRAYFRPHGLTQLAAFELDVPEDLEGARRRTAVVYELIR
jgi:predicted nicotinamide N-methyase